MFLFERKKNLMFLTPQDESLGLRSNLERKFL
jgi:hypothetical protein